MPAIDLLAPVTVEIDIPVTRRLKIHAVVDGAGEQVFHSRRISEVFTYLVDNGISEFTMLDEDAEFRVTLRAPLAADPNPKG